MGHESPECRGCVRCVHAFHFPAGSTSHRACPTAGEMRESARGKRLKGSGLPWRSSTCRRWSAAQRRGRVARSSGKACVGAGHGSIVSSKAREAPGGSGSLSGWQRRAREVARPCKASHMNSDLVSSFERSAVAGCAWAGASSARYYISGAPNLWLATVGGRLTVLARALVPGQRRLGASDCCCHSPRNARLAQHHEQAERAQRAGAFSTVAGLVIRRENIPDTKFAASSRCLSCSTVRFKPPLRILLPS